MTNDINLSGREPPPMRPSCPPPRPHRHPGRAFRARRFERASLRGANVAPPRRPPACVARPQASRAARSRFARPNLQPCPQCRMPSSLLPRVLGRSVWFVTPRSRQLRHTPRRARGWESMPIGRKLGARRNRQSRRRRDEADETVGLPNSGRLTACPRTPRGGASSP